jgi:DNA (cytosine-5)-methyltransferase 1
MASAQDRTASGKEPQESNREAANAAQELHNPHYQPWEHLTDEDRERYRKTSTSSRAAKLRAMNGEGPEPLHEINSPVLDPLDLMPQLGQNSLSTLSLFSGCGGLDIGFERAGFAHLASYDVLDAAGETLRHARPDWTVYSGDAGDVRKIDWMAYGRSVDVVHGGPPCQPFSAAGRQQGKGDRRDMFPEFVRAVLALKPKAFLAENVPALLQKKFSSYLQSTVIDPLSSAYHVRVFELKAEWFGVPQVRRRVFFVGFSDKEAFEAFAPPRPTHDARHLNRKENRGTQPDLFSSGNKQDLPKTMGVRAALGLADIGYDGLAPTIRSTLTGPRHTTSILSSVSAQKRWDALRIWPNGVAPNRQSANEFVAKNGHFRLSVPDIGLIQGFPENWPVTGATYMALGQIGNAVPPPLAYQVARSISEALG